MNIKNNLLICWLWIKLKSLEITAQGQIDAKEIAALQRASLDKNTAAIKKQALEERADKNFRESVAKFTSLLQTDEKNKFIYEQDKYRLAKDAYKNAYESTSPATRKLLELKHPDELYPEQNSGDNKGNKPASTTSGRDQKTPPPPEGFQVQP